MLMDGFYRALRRIARIRAPCEPDVGDDALLAQEAVETINHWRLRTWKDTCQHKSAGLEHETARSPLLAHPRHRSGDRGHRRTERAARTARARAWSRSG